MSLLLLKKPLVVTNSQSSKETTALNIQNSLKLQVAQMIIS